GSFEVLDIGDQNPGLKAEALRNLAVGVYSRPEIYPVPYLRFANGKSGLNSDTDPDVRALSFSVELPSGRQDFSMNSVSIFPIESLAAFNLILEAQLVPARASMQAAAKETDPA